MEQSHPTLATERGQSGITPTEPAQTSPAVAEVIQLAKRAGRYEGLCPGGRGCLCPKRAER